MEDYRNMERCSGEPCCIFAERICADNEKEILKMEKDRKEKVMADEMVDDLIYLAELIDFTGIVSCLAVRGTLSERMTDKLTDSIAGMADEVLEKWEDYQDKTEKLGQSSKGDGQSCRSMSIRREIKPSRR